MFKDAKGDARTNYSSTINFDDISTRKESFADKLLGS